MSDETPASCWETYDDDNTSCSEVCRINKYCKKATERREARAKLDLKCDITGLGKTVAGRNLEGLA